MIATTNFLASWYRISSFHCGLSCANSVTKKLCNRNRATCDTAMSGCWFTRPSPVRSKKKNKKIVSKSIHQVTQQTVIMTVAFIGYRREDDHERRTEGTTASCNLFNDYLKTPSLIGRRNICFYFLFFFYL